MLDKSEHPTYTGINNRKGKKMTKFSDVKVGDRVRLTGNGEVHEFEVQDIESNVLKSEHNAFYYDDDWDAEILQKPLPTGEYAVIGSRKNLDLFKGFYFEASEWRDHDGMAYPEEEVREHMRNFGLEVLFEGVQK